MQVTGKLKTGRLKNKLLTGTARVLRNEEGGIATMAVLMMPMIIGFVGMAIDLTNIYLERRIVQSLTDMAAVEAAHRVPLFEAEAAMESAVNSWLSDKGYDSYNDTVDVMWPPQNGNHISDMNYAEVEIHRNVPLYFLSAFYAIFSGKDFTVSVGTRAVAGGIELNTGNPCIVAFNQSERQALGFGGSNVTNAACGIGTNSNNEESINVYGTANVNVGSMITSGDYDASGNSNLNVTGSTQTYAEEISDPFEDTPFPVVTDDMCSASYDAPGNSGYTAPDGTQISEATGQYFCEGLRIAPNTTVDIEPGTYYIVGSDLDMQGNLADTSIDGVTFVFVQNESGDVGSLTWNAQSAVELTAPSEGDYAGLLFAQDPAAGENTNTINGGADISLNGALYFKEGDLRFNGGASTEDACLLLYADTIDFTGGSNIGMDQSVCDSLGLTSDIIGTSTPRRVQLVE